RQYARSRASDPMAHAAPPGRGRDAGPVLGGAILRLAADRNGGAVTPGTSALFRAARRVPAAIGDVPAVGRRWTPAAVHHPHGQVVFPAALSGAAAGRSYRPHADFGSAHVRLRLARSV